ncbi:hypothetical protein Tco_1015609 [Tanacetum coccineum]|uniref:Uncharacterized protein n=1 Tax=Tanacetum coccineum TaxID=301880 RepID=A0ABQ5FMD4_9ASTR
MSADSAVTYTSVHSEARSWSIPSEDPYEEAARQLLEQAPRSPEYVPDPIELEDHVPVYIPEPEHPEDLVPAEDEAPTPPLPPFFLSPRTRAAMAQMRATTPALSFTTSIGGHQHWWSDMPPRKRILLTTPRPSREVGEISAAAACKQQDPLWPLSRLPVLRERYLLTSKSEYGDPSAIARSEAYYRALEARVTVLETEVRRHEWQRQAADDFAVRHIMRTQALEAGARVDTLEDTGSSS